MLEHLLHVAWSNAFLTLVCAFCGPGMQDKVYHFFYHIINQKHLEKPKAAHSWAPQSVQRDSSAQAGLGLYEHSGRELRCR